MKQEFREASGVCGWQKYAAAYTDGTLSPKKEADMRTHLCAGCAQCAAAVEREARLRAIYASVAPTPSEASMQATENRVMAAVREAPIAAAMQMPEARRLHPWKTVCGAALALLIVVGLVRIAPKLMTTADNASKEALGGCAFDQMENDAVNGKGEVMEDGNLAVDDGSVTDTVGTYAEYAGEATSPSFSYTQNDSLTPPADHEEVEGEAVETQEAPTEAESVGGTTTVTTKNECEIEAASCVYTVIIAEADAEEAYDLLVRVAKASSVQITAVTDGWYVSDELCSALCKALAEAEIAYRTDTRYLSADDAQSGQVYLTWTP